MADEVPEKVEGTDAVTAENLQFDQAEYQQPAQPMSCAQCQQPIADAYYAMNGILLCDTCRQGIQATFAGGSKTRRVFRAMLFGAGASIAGFALYYGVLKITGFEVGLISIVVGLMVGAAVRKGGEYRGGWVYQAIAMLLTYSAIAASYSVLAIPEIIAAVKKGAEAPVDPAANNEVNDPSKPAAADAKPAPDAAANAELPPLSPLELIVGLVVVAGFLFALPILAGFEQPIGLLIVGIALYEAWKINRRVRLEITGPHPVGQPIASAGVAAHG